MSPAELIRRRQQDWGELESMLVRFTRSKRRRATAAELSRFGALFRDVCADLARARAQAYSDDLIDYLNALAARSHNVFYTAPPAPVGGPWRFFARTFPLTVRKNAAYVLAGLFLFFAPMLGIISLARTDAGTLYQLVPERTLKYYEQMYKKGHAGGRSEAADAAMTGFYVRNNVGIAFNCFATGVFFGIGSIFFLLFNGVIIGAVFGFITQGPYGMNLLSFVAGHGPFELFAISLSGAAGLRLGLGAIVTGNRRRRDSLRLAATDAVRLVLGAAALLLGAALIEGFFSPSSLPMAAKFGMGGACTIFLCWYLGLHAARLQRQEQERTRREERTARAKRTAGPTATRAGAVISAGEA